MKHPLYVMQVSTMNLVWKVCQNNTFLIRKDMTNNADFQERLSQYRTEGIKWQLIGFKKRTI
jgi:3-keto-L-gulonate-6-phosphate decarboxylase